jgi:aspartyl-tRNA(Asn)/glutamyl-tRNA(Gln) amidotransferase subunit C
MADHDSDLAQELAGLARLELDDDEAEALGAQLETILGYIRRLQEVDVEGVPEYLSARQVRSGLRDDAEGPAFDAERALAGAPALRDRQIAVPKFKD